MVVCCLKDSLQCMAIPMFYITTEYDSSGDICSLVSTSAIPLFNLINCRFMSNINLRGIYTHLWEATLTQLFSHLLKRGLL